MMGGALLANMLCSAAFTLSLPNSEYACRYMDLVVKHSQANDVEPEVLVALIHEESRWTSSAVSRAGACGLTQVLPKYTKPRRTCSDLKKPRIAIKVGAKTLSYWVYEHGGGDYLKGLCGYNGGNKCGTSSKRYAKRVMRLARRLNSDIAKQRAYYNFLQSLNMDISVDPSTEEK